MNWHAPQFKTIPSYFLLLNKEHNLPVNNNLFSPSSSFSVSWVFSGRPSSWLVHPQWYLVLARLVHAQPGSAQCGRDCSCKLETQALTSIHSLKSIQVPICFYILLDQYQTFIGLFLTHQVTFLHFSFTEKYVYTQFYLNISIKYIVIQRSSVKFLSASSTSVFTYMYKYKISLFDLWIWFYKFMIWVNGCKVCTYG